MVGIVRNMTKSRRYKGEWDVRVELFDVETGRPTSGYLHSVRHWEIRSRLYSHADTNFYKTEDNGWCKITPPTFPIPKDERGNWWENLEHHWRDA
jgi:hypothetical protein